jgi:hypothetical protein
MKLQMTLVATALILTSSVALAGVTVVSQADIDGYSVDAPIEPLAVEDKDGHEALHMRLPCTGKGVSAIRYVFPELQDWSGYETMEFDLYTETTGEESHIQVQLFDAGNAEVRLRYSMKSWHLGKWREVKWNFARAKPEKGKQFDFSRVKMIFFSAWKDYYGHSDGHVVDYWIGPVTRTRAWEPTTLAVAPTGSAPAIDGSLDDAQWQVTPTAQQFFGRKGDPLPKETSELKLLWDADNLYLGLRCFAEVLNPVLQRQNEFVAKITEHDGKVFHDDSVEMFFAAADAPQDYMQFVSNALGARYEGKGMDGGWDAPWEAAGSTSEEGYWTLEVAIPWTSLGIDPSAGMTILGNAYRNNKAQDEYSMWSPVTFSFHAPDEFGHFVLLGSTPSFSVQSGTIPPLMIGENTISTTLTGGETERRFLIRLRAVQEATTKFVDSGGSTLVGHAATFETPILIEKPGEISVVYSVIDVGTDDLYFQSPICTFPTAAVETLTVNPDGPCEVFLNGAALGKGGQGELKGYLDPGANALCVKASEPVGIELQAGRFSASGPGGWLQSADEADGWMNSDFDDSTWQSAAATGAKLDTATGGCFRRTIAAQVTKFGNIGDADDIHIVAKGAQHLPLLVVSPVDRAIQNARFVLELPPGVELVPWDEKEPYKWTGNYSGFEATTIDRDGETWNRYELQWSLLQPLSYRGDAYAGYDLERIHRLGFVIRVGDIAPGAKQAYCWVEGEAGAVVEIPKAVSLTVLPPLPAKRPKQIELLMCHGFGGGGYAEQDMAALLDTMAAAGYNSYIERTHAREMYYPMLKQRGFKIVAESTHYGWHRGLDIEGRKFVDFDETHRGSGWTFACPLWIIEEGREAVGDKLAAYINEAPVHPDGLWWDMEYGPKIACFCEHCLKRFAEKNGIEEELTAEQVMEKHSEQWIDFTAQMWADLSGAYRDGFRKAVPDGEMYTYSGYQTAHAREHYCIDWSLMREGCDIASAGYGWNPQIIADTVEALDGTPLLGGVCYYQPPRHSDMKVEYLKLLAAGCKGVMHYTWQALDGLDYTRIGEAAALVADSEDFFTDGTRADELVEGAPKAAVAALKHGDRLLVLLLNPSSTDEQYSVTIPKAMGKTTEYYTGVEYATDGAISMAVPAHDARGLVVTVGQ